MKRTLLTTNGHLLERTCQPRIHCLLISADNLPAIAICCNTECDCTHGSEHQNERDAPGNVGFALVERFRQI